MDNNLNLLSKCLKALDLNRIYAFPDQPDAKAWLAKVSAVFKASGDYDEFYKHRQHLYSVIANRTTRKHAAQQLENMIREKIELWKNKQLNIPKGSPLAYINPEFIDGFMKKKDGFNYRKLVRLLNELNSNYAANHLYSTKMLIRGILDHIPPLLGCRNFNAVVESYLWQGETEKKYMKSLLTFKDEADSALHIPISDYEDLISIEDIPAPIRINRLLQECLKKGVNFSKSKVLRTIKQTDHSKLKVEILNRKVSWADYALDFPQMIWSSFKIDMEINNFNSNSPDYISVALKAKGNDGEVNFLNYIFMGTKSDNQFKPNQQFLVEARKKESIGVLISDTTVGTSGQRQMPDIDKDTLKLIVKTESQQTIIIPIKASWITKG